MPAQTAQLDVWNIALDHLVEHPLTATDDDSAYARWLSRNEENLQDAFLRQYAWNFAIQYNTLTVDGTDPAFRFAYRYALPENWLRVLPPTYQGVRGGTPYPHEIVGGYLYCDQPTSIYVRTVQRVTAYTSWDPIAVDAFALTLAVRMCQRFTGKATHHDRLAAELASVLDVAQRIDTMEGTPEPIEQHTVIDVRG